MFHGVKDEPSLLPALELVPALFVQVTLVSPMLSMTGGGKVLKHRGRSLRVDSQICRGGSLKVGRCVSVTHRAKTTTCLWHHRLALFVAVIATVGTVCARLGKAPQQLLAIVAVCGRRVLEAFKAMWMGEHTRCVT